MVEVLQPLLERAPDTGGASEEDREAIDLDGPGEDARSRIVSLLGPVPAELDDIVRSSGLTVATVRVVLLELDLAGRLIRDPAGRVSLA